MIARTPLPQRTSGTVEGGTREASAAVTSGSRSASSSGKDRVAGVRHVRAGPPAVPDDHVVLDLGVSAVRGELERPPRRPSGRGTARMTVERGTASRTGRIRAARREVVLGLLVVDAGEHEARRPPPDRADEVAVAERDARSPRRVRGSRPCASSSPSSTPPPGVIHHRRASTCGSVPESSSTRSSSSSSTTLAAVRTTGAATARFGSRRTVLGGPTLRGPSRHGLGDLEVVRQRRAPGEPEHPGEQHRRAAPGCRGPRRCRTGGPARPVRTASASSAASSASAPAVSVARPRDRSFSASARCGAVGPVGDVGEPAQLLRRCRMARPPAAATARVATIRRASAPSRADPGRLGAACSRSSRLAVIHSRSAASSRTQPRRTTTTSVVIDLLLRASAAIARLARRGSVGSRTPVPGIRVARPRGPPGDAHAAGTVLSPPRRPARGSAATTVS